MHAIDPNVLLVCCLIFIVLLFLLSSCSMKCSGNNVSEKYVRSDGLPYVSMCEFQPACLYDTARGVQLSNGMEGVCTLHGLACPSLSKDHNRARNMGLSPDMIGDRYMNELSLRYAHRKGKEQFNLYSSDWKPGSYADYDSVDESGSTALDIGGYPLGGGD